jgi:coenzyme Q-binding protein COQ10
MPYHQEQKFFPYSVSQLFNLVADVEKYPEFLPWCSAARILKSNENIFYAQLIIGFKGFNEKYTSKVTLVPSLNETDKATISVEMEEGPFTHLINEWKFTPKENGVTVDFLIDFSFKLKFLEKIMSSMFEEAFIKMVKAFEERAKVIYK